MFPLIINTINETATLAQIMRRDRSASIERLNLFATTIQQVVITITPSAQSNAKTADIEIRFNISNISIRPLSVKIKSLTSTW